VVVLLLLLLQLLLMLLRRRRRLLVVVLGVVRGCGCKRGGMVAGWPWKTVLVCRRTAAVPVPPWPPVPFAAAAAMLPALAPAAAAALHPTRLLSAAAAPTVMVVVSLLLLLLVVVVVVLLLLLRWLQRLQQELQVLPLATAAVGGALLSGKQPLHLCTGLQDHVDRALCAVVVESVCVCVCMCTRVCVCVRVCVRESMCAQPSNFLKQTRHTQPEQRHHSPQVQSTVGGALQQAFPPPQAAGAQQEAAPRTP